jgi:hypothetical protein
LVGLGLGEEEDWAVVRLVGWVSGFGL